MNIKGRRKIETLYLLLIIIIFSCSKHSHDNKIIVSLETVISNYPIHKVDTIRPLPRIYFILNFKNEKEEVQTFSFPKSIKSKTEFSGSFFAKMQCPNGQNLKLPLYQNTSKTLYLKPGEEDKKSFTVNPLLIERELSKCGNEYLGKLIELVTRNITFVYISNVEINDFQCIRNNIEAPEYFMIE